MYHFLKLTSLELWAPFCSHLNNCSILLYFLHSIFISFKLWFKQEKFLVILSYLGVLLFLVSSVIFFVSDFDLYTDL